MSFQLSPNSNNQNAFLVNKSELEGRLDPFCYIPELVDLDNRIKTKAKYHLKDFVKFRASGATPSKSNDAYYSDRENGIPFIRVQNLSITGEIDQSNLVYISKETHEELLKRSQVKEHDLLIKITGVGRMAVASVAPDDFEGNINQHIVLVRTGSKEISENIAAFLNLDSIEKIASKRATGGTRPALDYPALFSIPVINERKVFLSIQKAITAKKEKETESQRLLDSIDEYLLDELGIELPEQEENTVQERVFTRQLSKVSGKRFDPKPYTHFYVALKKKISNGSFKCEHLSELTISSLAGAWGIDENSNNPNAFYKKCLVIRATEFDNDFNLKLHNSRVKYRLIPTLKLKSLDVQTEDILLEKSGGGPKQPVGRVAIITKNYVNEEPVCYSNFIHKLRINTKKAVPEYVFCYLKTMHRVGLTETMQSQTNGIRNLIMGEYLAQSIPLPPIEKQFKISKHIRLYRK